MTEQQRLTSSDSQEMLRFITENPDHQNINCCRSERKMRLFACACYRSVWPTSALLLPAEEWADSPTPENERELKLQAMRAGEQQGGLGFLLLEMIRLSAVENARRLATDQKPSAAAKQVALLRDIVGNPYRQIRLLGEKVKKTDRVLFNRIVPFWLTPDVLALAHAAYDERSRQRRDCPRCEGESLGKLLICSTCNNRGYVEEVVDGTIDPQRLAVLADAIEEAGCDPGIPCEECIHYGRNRAWEFFECHNEPTLIKGAPLLAHLREPGPHIRGCHALDTILGRE